MATHKVFITDDDQLICSAMEILINTEEDMTVVGTAHNGADALDRIRLLQPDIVLMDVRMPIMNGIETTKKLRGLYPNLKILILTTFNEEDYLIEALANGANGYMLKNTDFAQIRSTIRNALSGQYMLSTEVAIKLSSYLSSSLKAKNVPFTLPPSINNREHFTNREQEIILLLGQRLSIREIADHLFIAEGTLKNYLTTIYHKLDVKNRHEAIQLLRSLVE